MINLIKGEQILLLHIIKLLSILIEKLPKLFNTENGKHDIAKTFWTRLLFLASRGLGSSVSNEMSAIKSQMPAYDFTNCCLSHPLLPACQHA